MTTMFTNDIYERYKDMEGLCKNYLQAKCLHDGMDCIEWTKPLWFKILGLHVKQACEFHIYDKDSCALSDEMFGVKAYFRSTNLQM